MLASKNLASTVRSVIVSYYIMRLRPWKYLEYQRWWCNNELLRQDSSSGEGSRGCSTNKNYIHRANCNITLTWRGCKPNFDNSQFKQSKSPLGYLEKFSWCIYQLKSAFALASRIETTSSRRHRHDWIRGIYVSNVVGNVWGDEIAF